MSKVKCFSDFTGGMNDTVPEIMLKSNEVCFMENAIPLPEGGFEKRSGTLPLNHQSFGKTVTQIIEWPLASGATKTIAIAGRYVYEANLNHKTYVKKDLPSNASLARDTVAYFFHKNTMYFTDGINFYVWGDSTFYRGSYAPSEQIEIKNGDIIKMTAAPEERMRSSFTDTAEDILFRKNDYSSDNFAYMSFINRPAYTGTSSKNIEGAFYTLDVGRNATYYSFSKNTNLDHSQYVNFMPVGIIDHYYKYNGNSGYLAPRQQNYMVEPNWTDVTGESGIADSIRLVTTGDYNTALNTVKRCRHFVYHPASRRYFASGDKENPTALYYTSPDDPLGYSDSCVIYPQIDSGHITAISSFSRYLVVFNSNGISYASSNDPVQEKVFHKLSSTEGCISSESLCEVPGGIIFMSLSGLCKLTENMLDESWKKIKILSANKIENLISTIADKKDTFAVYGSGKYYLCYKDKSGSSKILVHDIEKNCFYVFSGFSPTCFLAKQNGDLIFGTYSYICKMFTGIYDFNCTVNESGIETPSYSPVSLTVKSRCVLLNSDKNILKPYKILSVFVSGKQNEADNDKTISLSVTSDYSQSTNPVSLSESLIWGRSYGKKFGFSAISTSRIKLSQSGVFHSVTISDDGAAGDLCILHFGLEYEGSTAPLNELIDDNSFYKNL